jgi:hypothetical protein
MELQFLLLRQIQLQQLHLFLQQVEQQQHLEMDLNIIHLQDLEHLQSLEEIVLT